MQTKLKKQTTNKKHKVKGIANNLVVSFFFFAFFITICFFIIGKDFNLYLSILNKMTTIEANNDEQNVSINPEYKKFDRYPSWGKKYATLKIDSINLELPVYHGDTMKILKKGIGHYSGSYFNGEGGSVIFAGHSDYLHHLPEVKINDIINVDTIYGKFKYRVYQTKVIKRTDENALPITKDKEILMIYTCYPVTAYGNPKHRFVVYANLVEASYE